MTVATVLVPTHDHGPTLRCSVASALAQTVADLEVLVVGDGVADDTRHVMTELVAVDERVRFLDNPKGPRHGELLRHAALQQARGEIVCYLSDDDLWLPEHVEELGALLEQTDFAHSLPVSVRPDGSIDVAVGDLAVGHFRDRILAGENFVPLSCGAHTMALYRRLPHGWRTSPPGVHTDLYMWQQILSVSGCRAVSGDAPTAVHFPSPWRAGWPVDERARELDDWTARLAGPAGRGRYLRELLMASVRERVARDIDLKWSAARVVELEEEGARLHRDHRELGRRLGQAEQEQGALRIDRQAARDELDAIKGSRTWRLRGAIESLPGARTVARRLGARRPGSSG
jgi:GalNAc5-diNAcBac-PP-undecaprenol beta-1,3-glucosyltransferase